MNNLEYDNLYKFLVSLGIILIVLPTAILIFLFNSAPTLISQVEYDALSSFSLQIIQVRETLNYILVAVFPWVSIISIIIGFILLVFGIRRWARVQNNLDKKLDAETTLQTLAVLEMNNQEITEKIEDETKEESPAEVTNIDTPSAKNHLSRMEKYREIEELCLNYLTEKYSKRYSFKRNIRIGKFKYDFIGVSQKDDIDLIVEVKYWNVCGEIMRRLYSFLDSFYDAGVNYETIAHRNFRCIAIIVTSQDQLPRLESIVERYYQAHWENASKIEIKCFAEEAL